MVQKLTIVWLDPLQVHLPAEMLAVDLAHVGNKEGFFLSSFAGIDIDATDMVVQGSMDDCLSIFVGVILIAIVVSILLGNTIFQNNWFVSLGVSFDS